MAEEVEQRIALLQAEIDQLRSELSQGIEQVDKDPGGFIIGDMQLRLRALEDREFEVADPDSDEMPDPIIPFFGEGDTPSFSGTVYIEGLRVTDLNSQPDYPWIRVRLSGDPVLFENQVTEQPGPPPSPFPQNEEWYEKANTYGDLHVPRF